MKRKIWTLALGLMMAASAKAQIQIMEDERNMRDPKINEWPVLPAGEGERNESFTPIGSGVVLLAALGGAYLLGKRNKER